MLLRRGGYLQGANKWLISRCYCFPQVNSMRKPNRVVTATKRTRLCSPNCVLWESRLRAFRHLAIHAAAFIGFQNRGKRDSSNKIVSFFAAPLVPSYCSSQLSDFTYHGAVFPRICSESTTPFDPAIYGVCKHRR